MRKIMWVLLSSLLIHTANVDAQTEIKDSILLTGIVVEGDSLNPLVATHFIINNDKGGITDKDGHFHFYARIGDTIQFSYVGYKTVMVILIDTLPPIDYLLGIRMTQDTIPLKEVIIYPRIVGDINTLMTNTSVQSKSMDNAANNIRFAKFQGLTQPSTEWDADMSQKLMMQQQTEKNINKGLISPDQMISITAVIPLTYVAIQRLKEGPRIEPKLTIEEESKLKSLFKEDVEVE